MLIWTAGYEVLVNKDSANRDADAYGAFVNIYGIAQSSAHFRELAAAALEEDGHTVLEMEELQEIDLNDIEHNEEIQDLILNEISADTPILYGYFNTYPKDALDA